MENQDYDTALCKDLHNFAEILRYFGIYSEERLKDFEGCLLSETSPVNYYDFLNSGAFKECYRLTDNFIIKFAANDNESEREMSLLAQAQEAGVDCFFLPTRFMFIESCKLPTYYIEAEDNGYSYYNSYYHEWRYREGDLSDYALISLFVQPFACKTCSEIGGDIISYIENEYNKEPIFANREPVPFEFIDRCNIYDRKWIEAAIELYGLEMLVKLGNFVKEHHMSDLHRANIGWLADGEIMRPIILDWLSG